MTLFEFMSDSPFLTAFIICCVAVTIEGCVKAITGYKSNDEDN